MAATVPDLDPPTGTPDETRSLRRGAGMLSLSVILVGAANFGYSVLLTWLLTVSGYAVFASAQALLLVAATVAVASVPWVLSQEITRAPDDPARTGRAVSFALVVGSVQAVVAGWVVAMIAMRFAGGMLPLVTGVSAVLIFFAALSGGYLQGYQRFGTIAALRVAEVSAKLVVGLVLVLLGTGAAGALAGFGVGACVVVLPVAAPMARVLVLRLEVLRDRRLWRDARGLLAIQAGVAVLASLDVIVAGIGARPAAAVASYQASIVLSRIPLFISSAVSMAVFPRLSARWGSTSESVASALRVYVTMAVPVAVVVATTPPDLIRMIFPAQYGGISSLLPRTAVAGVLIAAVNVVTTFFQATGRFRACTLVLWAGVVAQLGAVLLGLYLGGVSGLATGSACGAALVIVALFALGLGQWPAMTSIWRSALAALVLPALVLFPARYNVVLWLIVAASVLLYAVRVSFLRPAGGEGVSAQGTSAVALRGLRIRRPTGDEAALPVRWFRRQMQAGVRADLGADGSTPHHVSLEKVLDRAVGGRGRRRILLYGNYGNGNIGDEATLAGILEAAGSRYEVTVLSHHPEEVRRLHGGNAVATTSWEALGAFLRADLLAMSGGGVFGRGVRLPPALLPWVACLARLLGKRTACVSIGAHQDAPRWVLLGLRCSALVSNVVSVRDPESLLTLRPRLPWSARRPLLVRDPAIALPPCPAQRAHELVRAAGLPERQRPLIVSLQPGPDRATLERLLGAVVPAVDWWCARREDDVILAVLSARADDGHGVGLTDRLLAEEVMGRARHPERIHIIGPDLHPREMKALMGLAAGVIAVRLHAQIFAWSMQRPLLGIFFEARAETFLREVGACSASTTSLEASAITAWMAGV
jgi:O-antigen/teichoic acid export membrane protein/polysaccharide pyruvyl transferase WcaK-like protein